MTHNLGNIKNIQIYLIIVILHLTNVCCIWPPPYHVNLSHDETFVISELLDNSDVQDVYDEEEMIKKEELLQMNMRQQSEKYFKIHQHIKRQNENNKNNINENIKTRIMVPEFNPNSDESLPWKAGFVDENENFIPDKDMIYFDEAKLVKSRELGKRADVEQPANVVNYDYSNLKAEYNNNIKIAEKSKDTLKYSTVKEDESVKDSLKSMVKFEEKPKNCTAEEMKGIGIEAVECFLNELHKPKTNKHLLEKIVRICIIWLIVYMFIAIPLWCQYGWCCCCCRCKFCRPREEIDEVKKFFAENPVGVFHDAEGSVIKYKPTTYEKYAQKKLEKEIQRL